MGKLSEVSRQWALGICLQGVRESRTLEIQFRQIIENTDDIIVDFATGQGGSGSGRGHITVDFRWDFWHPDPTAEYYFAIVADTEAYNQTDWRTRTLTGFLQIITVA